jgi:hypothetical protein
VDDARARIVHSVTISLVLLLRSSCAALRVDDTLASCPPSQLVEAARKVHGPWVVIVVGMLYDRWLVEFQIARAATRRLHNTLGGLGSLDSR